MRRERGRERERGDEDARCEDVKMFEVADVRCEDVRSADVRCEDVIYYLSFLF